MRRYTDVREKLMDPKTSSWFLKFDPKLKNYTVPKCDTSFSPPRCSDLYHVIIGFDLQLLIVAA